uniref:Uncharacterized protein n=1 Tax=viral metagenome TaxID=1070528 RepID=A0A6M3K614_9ZZZZ
MVDELVQGPLSAGTEKAKSPGVTPDGITPTPKAPPKSKAQAPAPEPETTGQAEPGTETKEDKPSTSKKSVTEDSFFDPSTLDEKLIPAYKQMQGAFTKKMQAMSQSKEKIEAYDNFMANPEQNLQRAAQQYGFKMVPAGQAQNPQAQTQEPFGTDWQPQTWGEVYSAMESKIVGQMMDKLSPVFQNLQTITAKSVEQQLNEIDGNWRVYEDDMTANLKSHPTLAKDVSKLYRISVPEEVLKSKYTQQALKRFEEKATSAKVQSKSSIASTTAPSNKKLSFSEAVEEAKKIIGR